MRKHPHPTRSANRGWSPLRAHSAQGPGLTNHLLLPRSLLSQASPTPPLPPRVPQCEPCAQVSPWGSQGLISVSSSDFLSLDPACHIWFCRSLGSIRSLCVWGEIQLYGGFLHIAEFSEKGWNEQKKISYNIELPQHVIIQTSSTHTHGNVH